MTTKKINNGLQELTAIVASDGKVLRRKGTEEIYGSEVVLGYSYYRGGERLAVPHFDSVDDFEEVDAPREEDTGL